jgi:hypothetical protein
MIMNDGKSSAKKQMIDAARGDSREGMRSSR